MPNCDFYAVPDDVRTVTSPAMAADLRSVDRQVRFWSILFVGSVLGVRAAMAVYGGSSIALGLGIAGGIGVTTGLLSLCFGQRFWQFVGYLVYFFF